MKEFKVVDVYDGRDLLGYCDSIREVYQLARKRIEDTDSEFLIELRVLVPEKNQYAFFKILESC